MTRTDARWTWEHDDHRMEVRLRGDVTLTEAGDWVEALGPGAEAVLEEREGRRTRRLEFTPARGGVATRYAENGVAREVDAGARAWARSLLLRATRDGGLGMEQRVQRLRRRGGVTAVLNDAAQARSDVSRRQYVTALFASGPLNTGEVTEAMRFVERRMSSDTDRRLAVTAALRHGGMGEDAAAAVFRVVEAMGSDTDRRLVLTAAIERGLVRGNAVAPFFRAVGRIGSDTDRRLVLTRLIQAPGGAAMRPAFFDAVAAIGSDTDRRLVLSALLRADPPAAATLAALRATHGMGSDVDRRLVLAQVPADQLRTARIAAAYREAAERMGSQRDRELVLRRLAAGQ